MGALIPTLLWPHAETTNSEAYEVYALLDKELTTIEFKIFPTQLAIDELIIESHLPYFESDPYYNYGGCEDVEEDSSQEKKDGCIKGMESYLQDFNTKFVSSIKGPFKSVGYFYKGWKRHREEPAVCSSSSPGQYYDFSLKRDTLSLDLKISEWNSCGTKRVKKVSAGSYYYGYKRVYSRNNPKTMALHLDAYGERKRGYKCKISEKTWDELSKEAVQKTLAIKKKLRKDIETKKEEFRPKLAI